MGSKCKWDRIRLRSLESRVSTLPVQSDTFTSGGPFEATAQGAVFGGDSQRSGGLIGLFSLLGLGFRRRQRGLVGQGDSLSIGIDRQNLDFNVLPLLEHVLDTPHSSMGQLGNVDQTLDARCQFHEGTEVGDSRNGSASC